MIATSFGCACLFAATPVSIGEAHPLLDIAARRPGTGALLGPQTTGDEPAPATPPAEPGAEPEPGQNDIVVTARHAEPGDPLAAVNAKSFEITQKVDTAFIAPAAKAYEQIVPQPIANGIRNVLNNLHEPDIFVNFLLQHKIGKAAGTLARFVINSTIGVGGLFDMAKRKPFKLRRRPNGFADTFGFYGIKGGPFLYLPVIGPTNPRDLIGTSLDRFLLPFLIGKPFNRAAYTLPVGFFRTLDHRAQFDEQYEVLRSGSDPYADARDFYLRQREKQIDNLHSQKWRDKHPRAGRVLPLEPNVTPYLIVPQVRGETRKP